MLHHTTTLQYHHRDSGRASVSEMHCQYASQSANMRDRVPECEEECQSVRQIVSGAECQSVRQRGSMEDRVSEREIEGKTECQS
jgi:hypothetical protein